MVGSRGGGCQGLVGSRRWWGSKSSGVWGLRGGGVRG